MKIESIDSEEAKLYYEHYEVVQFVNNELHPAADAWAKEKLRKSLNTIVAQLKADGQSVLPHVQVGEDHPAPRQPGHWMLVQRRRSGRVGARRVVARAR